MTANKLFEITLTIEEAEELTYILHEAFRALKEKSESFKKDIAYKEINKSFTQARHYRNFFADLCGRHYMGDDA